MESQIMRPLALTRRSKYGAVRTIYNGVTYDSKLEARRAESLDLMIAGKLLASWERQVPFILEVNGEFVTTYRIDFELHWPDGSVTYEECKGKMTAEAIIKIKLWQALNPTLKLEVVRA